MRDELQPSARSGRRWSCPVWRPCEAAPDGPNVLFKHVAKTILETAFIEAIIEHIGIRKRAKSDRGSLNERNGTKPSGLDRSDGSCGDRRPAGPRQDDHARYCEEHRCRLSGVDETVLPVYAHELPICEVTVHFA